MNACKSHKPFIFSYRPLIANVALLKTNRNLHTRGMGYLIPLCHERSNDAVTLSTCGMGWNSSTIKQGKIRHIYPNYLIEMIYSRSIGRDYYMGQIHPQPMFVNSSICAGDQGSPLYVLDCASNQPVCLFGVATRWNWAIINGHRTCSQPNYFTLIEPLSSWIISTITTN